MNTETLDPIDTTTSEATRANASAPEPTLDELDTLKGASVQIKHDCTDLMNGEPHMWAGKHGTLVGTTPLGGVTIAVGKREKIFDRGQFTVTAPPGAQPADLVEPGAKPKAGTPPGIVPQLVNAAPLQAINSPTNPRKRHGLDIDSLRSLADSILAQGLMQPIIVRPLPASRLEETSGMEPRPAYEIVAGERRWRASQMAELATMLMLVRNLSDDEVLELQLVENIEREDLDPMEEAEGFALLREKLGYTVEQIAQRMGKGRGESYVRKRMKLLDLTPESREAMFAGTLQLSTGLLVAKYPAEKQAQAIKVIKKMETQGSDGEPIPAPFRTVALELYRKLNTLLATAAFNTADPGLVMTAGPCNLCPKRSRADQDLFAETTDAGADSCMDSVCWEAKKTAHVQQIHASARDRGLEVMSEAEAAKVFPSAYSSFTAGYTPIANTAFVRPCDDGEDRAVTYEDALRSQGRKAPKPIVVINPYTSQAVEVIPNELAEKLLPKEEQERRNGNLQASEMRRAELAKPLPPEQQALKDSNVRRAAFIRLFDGVRNRDRTLDDLRLVAKVIMTQSEDTHQHTELYFGWGDNDDGADLRDKIDALNADQLGQLITMATMEEAIDFYNGHLATLEDQAEFFTAQGLDILAVRDKVAEDLARQQREDSKPDSESEPSTWPFNTETHEGSAA